MSREENEVVNEVCSVNTIDDSAIREPKSRRFAENDSRRGSSFRSKSQSHRPIKGDKQSPSLPITIVDQEGQTQELCSEKLAQECAVSTKFRWLGRLFDQRKKSRPASQIYPCAGSDCQCKELPQHQDDREPQMTQWRIKNKDADGKTSLPVVALTLSEDATRVAYGGTVEKKIAPVHVYDLNRKEKYLFRRKTLIKNLRILDYPKEWLTQFEGNPSLAKDRHYGMVIGDAEGLTIFDIPSKKEIFNHTSKEIEKLAMMVYSEEVLLVVSSFSNVTIFNLQQVPHDQTGEGSLKLGQTRMLKQEFHFPDSDISDIALTVSQSCRCPASSKVILLAVAQKTRRCVSIFELPEEGEPVGILVIELPTRVTSIEMAFSQCVPDMVKNSLIGKYSDYRPNATNFLALASGPCTQVFSIECFKPPSHHSLEESSFKFLWEWEEVYQVTVSGIVEDIDLSQDGVTLVIADDSKQVSIFDVFNGAQVHAFKQGDRVKGLVLCAKARMLAIGSFDQTVTVHDLYSGLEVKALKPEKANVISVSYSKDGSCLAVGCCDGTSKVYNTFKLLEEDGNGAPEDDKSKLIFKNQSDKAVRVVHLTQKGELLATGGFDQTARIFDIRKNKQGTSNNKAIWKKAMDNCIWTMFLMQRKEHWIFAVGDWGGKFLVFKFHGDVKDENENIIFEEEFKDRIFSLYLNDAGSRLAVGCRDCTASIYDLEKNSKEPIFKIERGDRVYTTAISRDDKLIAVAGVDKVVALYEMDCQHLLKEFMRAAPINIVQFSYNGKLLGAVGNDGLAVLYDIRSMEIIFQHNCHSEVSSFSFSSTDSMAVSSQCNVYIFGTNKNNYGLQARPSFHYAIELFEDRTALNILVKNHPTIANCRDFNTGDTVLHCAVRGRETEVVNILLSTDCTIGLTANSKGFTAIHLAVIFSKEILVVLLRAVVLQKISNLPGSMDQLTVTSALATAIPKTLDKLDKLHDRIEEQVFLESKKEKADKSLLDVIGDKFPDLFLQFFTCLKLEEAGPLVLGENVTVPLGAIEYVWCDRRAPRNLWESYFHKNVDRITKKGQKWYRKIFDIGVKVQRSVKCYRVPIRNFAKAMDLKKVVKCAYATQDFGVFGEDTVVSEIINFKLVLIRKKLISQFIVFLTFLFTFITWSYYSAKYVFDKSNTTERLISIVLGPLVGLGCLYFFYIELKEINGALKLGLQSGLQAYIFSSWNVIDWLAFGFSFISLVMNVILEHESAAQYSAVAIIFLVLKILYYARLSEAYSLVVRTLLQVFLGISSILFLFAVMVLGFACSYWVLIGSNYLGDDEEDSAPGSVYFRTIPVSTITMFMMIFGEYGALEDYLGLQDDGLAVILLMVLLVLAVILLLNVVIAKMGDIYNDVRDNSWFESTLENARILSEIEEHSDLPQWLHCLKAEKQDPLVKRDKHIITDEGICELTNLVQAANYHSREYNNLSQIEDSLQRLKVQVGNLNSKMQKILDEQKNTKEFRKKMKQRKAEQIS